MLILSVPPATIHSAIPIRILAVAIAIVSKPDAQYLFTVIPGTSIPKALAAMILPTCKPCSASGTALPTITSSTCFGSSPGIDATNFVERNGQKAIIIGDKGSRIKQIGMAAREDMEALFERKIMLNLWVKVKQGWSDDARALTSLGY